MEIAHLRWLEAREILGSGFYPWLGGMFSVGGSLSLNFSQPNDSGRVYVKPVLAVTDKSQLAMNRLARLIPGKVSADNPPTNWTWLAETGVIVPHLQGLGPSCPHRQALINLILPISSKLDTPCPQTLARRLKAEYQLATKAPLPASSVYSGLIMDPYFLAGVFDSRAGLAGPENDRDLRIYSTNLSLLNALSDRFGRQVSHRSDHGGFIYSFSRPAISRYLEMIAPHVVLKPELHVSATSLFVHQSL